jgi:CubicO group peptidase (beta-lactamase class C family)
VPSAPQAESSSTAAEPLASAPAASAPAALAPAASVPPPDPPEPRPVDPRAVERLIKEAQATDSDAVLVLQHGKIVGAWSSPKGKAPIHTMSITKSVLALTVGCLVDAGKLSIDEPVAKFFSAWTTEQQRAITVRHLLTHSSGLEEPEPLAELSRAKNVVEYASRAPVTHPPGTHYQYGNLATNLLAGVVGRAAGKPVDQVARECLFGPLGITRYAWGRDRANNAYGHASLHLLPRDLAKIGELVLAQGEWKGRRLLSREWVRLVTAEPAQLHPQQKRLAHLWGILPESTEWAIDASVLDSFREAGVSEDLIAKLSPLRERRFRSVLDFVGALRERTGDPELVALKEEVWKRKLPDARYTFGETIGCTAHGSLGQHLVVVPRHGLVAVRMRGTPADPAMRGVLEKDFPDFPDRVVNLVVPPPPSAHPSP